MYAENEMLLPRNTERLAQQFHFLFIDHGPRDPTTDADFSEDAYFVTRVKLPDEKDGTLRDVTYFGVADSSTHGGM
jgi:hypothetical protein